MLKMNRRSALKASAATIAAASLPKISNAQAAFTPPNYVADDLKGQLTPFGAVRAGNADGSIPAWTGGGYPMPADYQQGQTRPIPFADEQPLFTINSSNMAQYSDNLSAGQKALLQKYSDYAIQVFPTHRTAAAPQYIYDYIYKNVANAKISDNGQDISGAYGGIPFPFPKNGSEVVWNHLQQFPGVTSYDVADTYTITNAGEIVFENRSRAWLQYPYYIPNGEDKFKGFTYSLIGTTIAPPYQAGTSLLEFGPVDPDILPVEAWEYLVGQRRVRRAPELQFDTPNFLSGGTTNWDEDSIFSGQLLEYDFVYVGIKEMFVPYNANKLHVAAVADQFKPHFVNPELLRWEKHRCRVVEMTLKAGFRNVDARRTIYFDEDTGSAVLGEVYDASGSLWKVQHNAPAIYGDIPAVVAANFFLTYDLHSGVYAAANTHNAATTPQWKILPELPSSFFTVGQLAGKAGGY